MTLRRSGGSARNLGRAHGNRAQTSKRNLYEHNRIAAKGSEWYTRVRAAVGERAARIPYCSADMPAFQCLVFIIFMDAARHRGREEGSA